MENEKSAKSSRNILKTKFQQLGYVFESQLTDFDTNVLPKECDVISVWISKVRNMCKKTLQPKKTQKNSICLLSNF